MLIVFCGERSAQAGRLSLLFLKDEEKGFVRGLATKLFFGFSQKTISTSGLLTSSSPPLKMVSQYFIKMWM